MTVSKDLGILSQRRRQTEMHRLSGSGNLGLLAELAEDVQQFTNDLPVTLESMRMGRNLVNARLDIGRLMNDGHAGLGESSYYNEGAGRHVRLPFLGEDRTGLLPPKEDTRGYATDNTAFMHKVKGHVEVSKYKDMGESALYHGGDEVKLGHEVYPTKWFVYKRAAPKVGAQQGQFKAVKKEVLNVPAGEANWVTVKNDENTLADTDVDVVITLLNVGASAKEIEETETLKGKASTAIAAANAAIADAKGKGADVSGSQATADEAQEKFLKLDYKGAEASAKSAQSTAIMAGSLAEKLALEKQKAAIASDPTIPPAQKAQMQKDIDDQKAAITTTAQTQTAEVNPPFTFGMNVGTFAIVGIIATIVGVGAAVAMKK